MRRHIREGSSGEPIACVIGEIDLLRSLALAGIRCALVAHRGDLARFSRAATTRIDLPHHSPPSAFADLLIAWARAQPARPVLFYDGDWDLLMVSEYRNRLREAFQFVIPEHALVLDLVDKSRFARLAEARGLPVPRAVALDPDSTDAIDLRYPIILKPLTRHHDSWKPLSDRKAIRADTPADFRRIRLQLGEGGLRVLAQELIPGPERLIESYHVYADEAGQIVGEFTGRKIRTYPLEHGYSTALETSDAPDVRALGRDVIDRINFSGVAKLDFKRHPDTGELFLLEINPRFSLWQHLGAKAGVNLAHAVYTDLTGARRPPMGRARPGVRWVSIPSDLRAARAEGIPFTSWLSWMIKCQAKHGFAWDDPLPLVAGFIQRVARRGP